MAVIVAPTEASAERMLGLQNHHAVAVMAVSTVIKTLVSTDISTDMIGSYDV